MVHATMQISVPTDSLQCCCSLMLTYKRGTFSDLRCKKREGQEVLDLVKTCVNLREESFFHRNRQQDIVIDRHWLYSCRGCVLTLREADGFLMDFCFFPGTVSGWLISHCFPLIQNHFHYPTGAGTDSSVLTERQSSSHSRSKARNICGRMC